MTERRLVLASRSARRKQLLEERGFRPAIHPPPLDDGVLRAPDARHALHWVGALAYLKARSVFETFPEDERESTLVLGSDTVVISHGAIIGQPPDPEAASRMIQRLASDQHVVATGVALVSHAERRLFVDTTGVRVGHVEYDDIERYVASGAWRGKAGGYNYADRRHDGWPLSQTGDPTTIMGLPMDRLDPALRRLGIRVD